VKASEYFICLGLAVVALVLAILVFFTGRSAQSLQAQLNAQQEEINKGSMSQQVGANLLRDSAQIALVNPRMRELLQRNGITVTPAPAPAANPAPAPAKK
jgi:Na+-transporting methylmalonyl-CoA/oxaloacetate decarboxylase gamma subunit